MATVNDFKMRLWEVQFYTAAGTWVALPSSHFAAHLLSLEHAEDVALEAAATYGKRTRVVSFDVYNVPGKRAMSRDLSKLRMGMQAHGEVEP